MEKNALTVLSGMQISQKARQLKHADEELGVGLSAPFAVIGYKGGKWSVRHRGNTTILMHKSDDGRFEVPMPWLDLVFLYAAPHNSKTYYEKTYQDGDDNPPDCWSTDGIKPDAAVPQAKKQNPTCHDCRHNAFGSKVNQATGARGKACADFRRLAVVPYPDLENGILGGPMLVRVPPASLGVLAEYGALLKGSAVPYGAIVTRLGFDPKEAYPKFTMAPLMALSDSDMDRVIAMQAHPLVDRIVEQQMENMTAQTGSEQGVNTTTPGASPASPKSDQGADPGPMPEHLRRNGAAASPASMNQTVSKSEPVAHGNNHAGGSGNPFAQAASTGPSYAGPSQASQPAETPPAASAAPAATVPQETPAETIARLQAELAAAKGGERRPRKPRTQPVAPSAQAEPASAQSARMPGEPIVPEEDEEDASDPALASINERLGKVMN